MTIRVFIVDDQDIVRQGLAAILSTAPQVEVVGQAGDGAAALEKLPVAQADVVLMDLKMPIMNGVQATQRIMAELDGVRVLILTTYDADEWVFDALRAGAAGYLLKDTPREQLIAAIEGTAEGRTYIDPAVAHALVGQIKGTPPAQEPPEAKHLSNRERDVLRLVAQGLTNADIAGRLHLSEGTVRNYVSRILAKLHVDDRTQAAVFALRNGLAD